VTGAIQTTEENNLMRQDLLGLVLGLVIAFAGMVAEGKITPKTFDGIMKAAEERIARRIGGG